MARLRTLCVTTADGPRDILILDKVDTLGQFQTDVERRKEAGLPPILMFDYEVDLPETDAAASVGTSYRTERTTVLLAANADEVREWAAHQPNGLDGVLVINATEEIKEGLNIPRRARIISLPGYEKLPDSTRVHVDAALHRAASATA